MSKPSTANLSVVSVEPIKRIQPPAGMSQDELAMWRDVVDSKPADWFGPDSAPLVMEYVRAQSMCNALDARVRSALGAGEDRILAASIKLRDTESRRLLSIATKLRLTQQSRYTPQAASTANNKAGNARPWQLAKS